MNLLSPLAISDEFSTVRLQHNRAFTELLNAANSSLYPQVTGHIYTTCVVLCIYWHNIQGSTYYVSFDDNIIDEPPRFFNTFCSKVNSVKRAAHSAYRFVNWAVLLQVINIIVYPCLFYRVSAQTHTVLL